MMAQHFPAQDLQIGAGFVMIRSARMGIERERRTAQGAELAMGTWKASPAGGACLTTAACADATACMCETCTMACASSVRPIFVRISQKIIYRRGSSGWRATARRCV